LGSTRLNFIFLPAFEEFHTLRLGGGAVAYSTFSVATVQRICKN